jgi:hypothetical protein
VVPASALEVVGSPIGHRAETLVEADAVPGRAREPATVGREASVEQAAPVAIVSAIAAVPSSSSGMSNRAARARLNGGNRSYSGSNARASSSRGASSMGSRGRSGRGAAEGDGDDGFNVRHPVAPVSSLARSSRPRPVTTPPRKFDSPSRQ